MSPLPTPDAPAGGLRFGVLTDGGSLRRWQADALRSMVEIEGVEPVVVIVDARRGPATGRRARVQRILRSKTRLWDLYNNGWVGRRAQCLRRVAVEDALGPVPELQVFVDKVGYSEYFPPDVLAELAALDLDVLLRFGFGILRGEVLDLPRFGVWSFHHDDEEVYRGSPPAFWELVDDQPVTGAILQRLTERLDGGRVLTKGWFRSVRHSYVRNTDQVHLGAAPWPASLCRAILAGDLAAAEGVPSPSSAPVYHKPTDAQTARFLVTQAGRAVASQARAVARADHWDIGVVDAPIHRFLDPTFEPAVEWLGLGAPASHYAADPFPLGTDPLVVLYERFDRKRRVGEIWEAVPGRVASARPSGLPISRHASYPYCFSHEGRTLCVPQIAGSPPHLFERRGVEWVDLGELITGVEVLDPTPLQHDGRWWLFGTVPGSGSLTHLHLWSADGLDGPWTAHPRNPVKSDVRSARPAGTPFSHAGRLYRPAQDCAAGYGSAVVLCEIEVLESGRYCERAVNTVSPRPSWRSNAGIHTLSAAGDRTLLDARRSVFDRHEAAAELRSRLRRIGS